MSQNKAKTGDKRSKHALKSPKTRGEIIDKWITNGSVAASFCLVDLYKCLLFAAPNVYMCINLYKWLVFAAQILICE
jgi:hypothetical protein